MPTQKADDTNFEAEVLKSDKPVLVDFWAQWCGPCRQLGPILEELSSEREDIKIVKVDIDSSPESPAKYGVRGIPTMIIFKNGEALDTAVGAKPKAQITQWLDEKLA